MKLETRKLGPLRDRLEVVGDYAGEYRVDRKPEGPGEIITIRVVA